jgi:hypothetical protein
MRKEPFNFMKKTFSLVLGFSFFVFSNFAQAQFGQPPMFMDAQASQMQMGQMQMMGQGGMPPGFVGQVPGSYNDAQCLNAAMMMPQAPLTPAYYNQQQQQLMNGHQQGF